MFYTKLNVTAGQPTVAALVRCLQVRQQQPCPDTNDLALNALDCLRKLAFRLLLAALPSQLLSDVLVQLCYSMAGNDTPLRLRVAAAGVIQKLALLPDNLGILAQAAGNKLVTFATLSSTA